MEDELFYVGLRDPVELRKELLLSSKNLIDSLRKYEAYKDIKIEKLRHVLQLKHVFDELLVLNKKLRGKLPRMPVKVPPTTREPHMERQVRGKPVRIEKTKMEELEAELEKIEGRLGSLQ